MKTLVYLCSILVLCIKLNAQSLNYQWVNSFGGTLNEDCNSFKLDSLGNTYVLGDFIGTVDFDPTSSVSNLVSFGGQDVFLAKYNSNGNFMWAINIGGTQNDVGYYLELDKYSNPIITGAFRGTIDIDPSSSTVNLISNGLEDIFIVKFNSNGALIFGHSFGDANNNYCTSIITDNNANIYFTGILESSIDFDPSSAIFNITPSVGHISTYFTKLDMNGNFVWAKSIDNTDSYTYFESKIFIDNNSTLYLTGSTANGADFDPSITTYTIGAGGFLSKYDINGNFIFAENFSGGVSNMLIHNNSIFITGGAGGNIFIAKYTNMGNFCWSKSVGGYAIDAGLSIAMDNTEHIFVTGYFIGTVDFDPTSGVDSIYTGSIHGEEEIFITKYDTLGNYFWTKHLGSPTGNDYGEELHFDKNNNLYLCGEFQNTVDFDFNSSIANSISNGGFDAFIAKYGDGFTAIDEKFTNKIFEIYPNPANKNTSIKFATNNDLTKEIIITNNLGEVIFKNKIDSNTYTIDTQFFPSGLYNVSISSNLFYSVNKLIIYH